uniref:Calcium and integrin-binding family member 2 isoform X3 n=1 Tax=Castor canadensis TaxID=51338 RepID=A0A8B7U1Z2_CASCN|nr:calcium and integrin-binding family member 2 isoform X3 [Castor canadensis]
MAEPAPPARTPLLQLGAEPQPRGSRPGSAPSVPAARWGGAGRPPGTLPAAGLARAAGAGRGAPGSRAADGRRRPGGRATALRSPWGTSRPSSPRSSWTTTRLHARFYELAPNLVPMDYRKSPTVHVPMSLIIQMPELRVGKERLREVWSLS